MKNRLFPESGGHLENTLGCCNLLHVLFRSRYFVCFQPVLVMAILLCKSCRNLLNTTVKLKSIPSYYPTYFKTYCWSLKVNVFGTNRQVFDYPNVYTSLPKRFSTLPELKDPTKFKRSRSRNRETKDKVSVPNINNEVLLDLLLPHSETNVFFDIERHKLEETWQDDISVVSEVNQNLIPEKDVNLEYHCDTDQSKNSAPQKKKKKAVLEEITQQEHKVFLETLAKASHHKKLSAYLDVCLRTNQHKKAYRTLVHFLTIGKKRKHLDVDNIKIFNIVFQAWAAMGELKYFKNMYNMLLKEGVALNYQSFAFWLECVSRQKTLSRSELHEEIELILKRINSQGLVLEEIFIKTILCKDQQERILDVLKPILPHFKPLPVTHLDGYSSSLLKSLNHTVKVPSTAMAENIASQEELKLWSFVQLSQELQGEVTIKSVFTKDVDSAKTQSMKEKFEKCEDAWREAILPSFKRNLKILQEKFKSNCFVNTYPFLVVLPPEVFVDLIIQEIRILLNTAESYGWSINTLHKNLAIKVMKKYFSKIKQADGYLEQMSELYNQYLGYCVSSELSTEYTPREYWQLLLSNMDATLHNYKLFVWPYGTLVDVGAFLYSFILNDVKIDSNLLNSESSDNALIPAFYKLMNQKVCSTKLEIKPHPLLLKLYRESSKQTISFDVSLVPMLCPPVPWNKMNSGSFLISPATFIRQPDFARISEDLFEGITAQQLYPVFDSLNILGQCPWIINKPILDHIIEIFNQGGNDELDIPCEISSLGSAAEYTKEQSSEERENVQKKRSLFFRRKAETYSLWCDALYKLSIANHFRDRIFWFPHNLDFRGRVYPTPPHFNHLGSDLVRGILLFAAGKPLGENGLDWLKIHVVNLTGTKKRNSLAERLEYANEQMPEILDSADHPFSGNGWWKKADEPWQTLACCKEIAKAVRSQNPEEFICHFPVHQDGSCNGLQHYAALGRDLKGAQQVNLAPSERPHDVYSAVAAKVERLRQGDAVHGNEIAQSLEGYVNRKVVKQTVMTIVYGVTRYGARHQIIRRLNDMDSFPKDEIWKASGYLVARTFESIGELFSNTRVIQDWFTTCARQISQMRAKPVEWVTPLGLPVIQPYFRDNVNNKYFHKTNKRMPNLMKQKNAFPPNYIHSLDSTHMMLTSLFCQREGIRFVSVHDCYWTHPSTVEIMNQICREQFVTLHSEPLLENLSQFFIENFSIPESEISLDTVNEKEQAKVTFNKILKQIPKKGEIFYVVIFDRKYC